MSKFGRLLDELNTALPTTKAGDKELFIENRAQQVIASAANLMKLINETYDEELAEELTKRLVNSIKSGDENKFRRKIREVREYNINGEKESK